LHPHTNCDYSPFFFFFLRNAEVFLQPSFRILY
jgi:hypothetical protein